MRIVIDNGRIEYGQRFGWEQVAHCRHQIVVVAAFTAVIPGLLLLFG
jgi:hypothetical protein